MTRVVCRIFIKAPPQDVWDAICPALKQSDGSLSAAGGGLAAAARPGDHAAKARHAFDLITIGEVLEADPPGRLVHALDGSGREASARPVLVSWELRDTLTGYTALTVSCEPDGGRSEPEAVTAGAYEWDRLLSDLKTVLEAAGRTDGKPGRPSHRRAGASASARIRPLPHRPYQAGVPQSASASVTSVSFDWARGANVSARAAGGAWRRRTRSQPTHRGQ
jgi:hypothetical protein